MRLRSLCLLSVGLVGLLLPRTARATDGVIEINQAQVVASGGFPFLLSDNSYRLTGNISATGTNATANTDLFVAIGSTTLDLNGFTISGLGASGTARCIQANGPTQVRNGMVTGCGADNSFAVQVHSGIVDSLLVTDIPDGGGVGMMFYGEVLNTKVSNAGGVGIYLNYGVVSNCVSHGNATGFEVTQGTIDNSLAFLNTGAGMKVALGIVHGSHSNSNGGAELECLSSCAIGGNIFTNCVGAACFSGTIILQTPPASNACGGDICP